MAMLLSHISKKTRKRF